MKKKDCIAKTVVTSSAEKTVRAIMCSGLRVVEFSYIMGFYVKMWEEVKSVVFYSF